MSVDDLVKKDSSFGISNFISAANSIIWDGAYHPANDFTDGTYQTYIR